MISPENRRYIEDNWAKLSPAFRTAHNRLRQKLGMQTLPPPKIDLYVPPRGPTAKPFDFSDKEFVAAGRQFLAPALALPGDEGFTINGETVRDLRPTRRRPHAESEGFTIR